MNFRAKKELRKQQDTKLISGTSTLRVLNFSKSTTPMSLKEMKRFKTLN